MNQLKNLLKKISPLVVLFGGGVVIVVMLQMLLFSVFPSGSKLFGESKKNLTATVVNSFENIQLEAHAAYVFDLNTNQPLFALNENEKLPLASITKLMTAFVARSSASESAIITTARYDLETEGDSGLRVGERWRMGDLLNLMLIISSNDAAHSVARFIGAEGQISDDRYHRDARAHFIQMMNEKARTLGLAQMEFLNETGLDIENISQRQPTQNGGYGSARDVAFLFAELWKKYPTTVEVSALPAARIISQDNIVHVLPNTDEAIGKFSGLIASKTGYTTLAGGNLAIIFDRGVNQPVVAVVIRSTQKGRFEDMEKLVSAVRKATSTQKQQL